MQKQIQKSRQDAGVTKEGAKATPFVVPEATPQDADPGRIGTNCAQPRIPETASQQ